MPSRRAFLQATGAALATAAVAGGGLVGVSLLPPSPRTARSPLRAFSPRVFSILAAVADRICPGTETLPSAWSLGVPESVDQLMDRLHPSVGQELSQALLFLENPVAGTLLDGRWARFTACSPEVQDEALLAFAESDLAVRRQAYQALSGLVSATYWSHPSTWPHIGYPGPPRFPANDPDIPWAELPPRRAPSPPASEEQPEAPPELSP